jgi:signal transduction histidine kinase
VQISLFQGLTVLSGAAKIISECIDTSLSDFADKDLFYHYERQSGGSLNQNGSFNFDTFHLLLKNFYGTKHYEIERKMIQVLHERASKGVYSRRDEIEAFSQMVDVFLKETSENLDRHKKMNNRIDYTRKLQEELRDTQEKAKIAERMAIIGRTAGMVGHDIRNPLQAIIGDLFLIRQELESFPQGEGKKNIIESLGSIDDNVTYINKIVTDLQVYTKPLTPVFEEIKLENLVKSTLSTVKIPSNIHLKVELSGDFCLKTDPPYLRRALTNLIRNAVQAMPAGGELTIRASYNKEVRISVEDSGGGIPEEVKEKLFTPLFTTKSKGQGLGLAVVKRLVEGLGGIISFESQVGKGTKFEVELPREPA